MSTTTTTTTTASGTTGGRGKGKETMIAVLTEEGKPAAQFSMGLNTLVIDMDAVHGENRRRLADALRRDERVGDEDVVLLAGGSSEAYMRDSTDHEDVFRQESFFHWAFGVREPDVAGTLDLATGEATLYIPRFPESYAVWMGPIRGTEYFKALYGVDHVRYADELGALLGEVPAQAGIHVLDGVNTDSGSRVAPPNLEEMGAAGGEAAPVTSVLHETMIKLRSIKTEAELEIMRYVTRISSEAHVKVMQELKPGMYEYQGESLFMHHCYFYGGHRHVGYTCICGSGVNGAILHYGHAGAPNDQPIRDGDMCLFDMGGEYACYGADITCSFPANGVFSPPQAGIYNVVLNAVKAVEAAMAPGVEWTDMHLLAERTILEGLAEMGIVKGSVDDMMDAVLAPAFMPHGLGHLLGIDTHDVGGYLDGKSRASRPGLASLRMDRPLEEGMVITVEPGVYFIDSALDKALANPEQAKFIDQDVLASFRSFGGVRIEDDVVVVTGGIENLTNVPREVPDIEAVMAGSPWPLPQ